MTYPSPDSEERGWIAVQSSCLSEVRIVPTGPSAAFLDVCFRQSGKRYRYAGVDYPTIADLLSAPSVGAFYNDRIKGKYTGRELHSAWE